MSHTHRYDPLFRSPLLEVGDFLCRDDRRSFGAEEEARASEIVFVRRGLFERRLRGRDALVDSTQVAFTNAGTPYRVRHPVGRGDACTVMLLGASALHELARAADPAADERPDSPFARSEAPCDAALFAAQARLRAELLAARAEGRTSDALAVEEAALALCARALALASPAPIRRAPANASTAERQRELVELAKLLLAERFREQRGVGELAQELRCSPYHLSRVFHRLTGCTLVAHRNRLRLRAALERVVAGAPDLGELALELGYASHAHLSDSFRREYGMSPSQAARPRARRKLRTSKDLEA